MAWPGPGAACQIRPPTWPATWLRMASVTCWYRAAMDALDHPISDNWRGLAQGQQDGRGGVPGGVQPSLAQPGVFEQPLPLVVVGVRVERLPGGAGEQPASLMPELACDRAFPLLLGKVGAEQGNELWRQADRAASGLRLDSAGVGAGVLPLRAVAGCPAASAAAAVRVLRAQPGAADADGGFVQVDAVPLESERLALPQPQRERQRPPGAVTPSGGGFEQPLDLRHVVRLDVLVVEHRGVGQLGGIAPEAAPADGLFSAARIVRCT